MKRTIGAATIPLFGLALPALAESGLGILNCKITDQIVLVSEDGKPERYTGIADGPSVGDEIYLSFRGGHGDLYLELSENYPGDNGKKTDGVLVNQYFGSSKFDKAFDSGVVFSNKDATATLGENYIRLSIEGQFEQEFRLRRYYKSDWHGLFGRWVMNDGVGHQSYTFDCRTMSDTSSKTIQNIKEAHNVGRQ